MRPRARPPGRIIHATIDPIIDERLRARAETEGRPMSRIMEDALRRYLDAPAMSERPYVVQNVPRGGFTWSAPGVPTTRFLGFDGSTETFPRDLAEKIAAHLGGEAVPLPSDEALMREIAGQPPA
jgi:hypothetical protein